MKVLLLSDTYSEHTEKWALGLADLGIQIGLFSFNKASYEWYNHPNITVYFEPDKEINAESTLTKLSYLKYVKILKKIIKQFNPDILHAHYATSYGLVGALSGFKPFILSVWGSDVYDFPKKSKLHKKVFQYNLKKAQVLMSTSEVMKLELSKYTSKPVIVTPFGVDTKKFSRSSHESEKDDIIKIGTIKPIEEKYGIKYIIEAAELVKNKYSDKKFKFYLIGRSFNEEMYKTLIRDKNLESVFELTGRISFNEIAKWHNKLDIFLNVSIDDSESFGVATVEAMCCETPVIVTDVGGLKEVVGEGKFGKVIPKMNAQALFEAISDIVENPIQSDKIAKEARLHVLDKYDWNNNLALMVEQYKLAIQ
ncbi:MAG: glycosyltransferase [Sphingobacteriaceae bacterium]|nr:glycosyltransferase [Sphingobacteriaceae bacterium]